MIGGGHSPAPASWAGRAAGAPLRPAESGSVLGLTVLVSALAVTCLVRLAQRGTVSAPSFIAVLPFGLATAAGLYAMLRRGVDAGADRPGRLVPVLVLAAALALSLTGFLTRLSLSARGTSVKAQPLVAALGLVSLFFAAHLAARYRAVPRLRVLTGAAAGLLALAQFVERPGREQVAGAMPPAAWSTPLLSVLLLALIASAQASPDSWLVKGVLPGNRTLGRGQSALLRTGLPVVAAIGLFAFTRDLAGATPLLAAGLVTAVRAESRASARAARVPVSHRAIPDRPHPAVLALAGAASYVLGVYLLILLSMLPGFHRATLPAVVGSGQPSPLPMVPGRPVLYGAGFQYRQVGPAGGGPDILAVIGRETGLAGLIGVALLFAGLVWGLLWLARRAAGPVGSACASALAWFVLAQVLLAVIGLPIAQLRGAGPPVLAGGAGGYLAVFLVIGAVAGLAWRGGGRPPSRLADAGRAAAAAGPLRRAPRMTLGGHDDDRW